MFKFYSLFWLIYGLSLTNQGCWAAKKEQKQIRIGALFGVSDIIHRTVFHYSVESLNQDSNARVKFVPMIMDSSSEDPLNVVQKACDLTLAESIAIFGPSKEPSLSYVRSICDNKEIPHFMTALDFARSQQHSYSINVLPSPSTIGSAITDLIKHYAWTSMIILYKDMEGLSMLQDVIQMSSMYPGAVIAVKQLRTDGVIGGKSDFTPLLKHVKEVLNENRIIIQADLESSRQLLSQAATMGMVTEYYHYIFTDLDMATLDLEPYKLSGCNVTALRIVNYESVFTKSLITGLKSALRRAHEKHFLPPIGIQTAVAVLYDSIRLLAEAVYDRLDSLRPMALDCHSDKSWTNGTMFMNHLKMMSYSAGTTGPIELDSNGERMDFNVTLVELTRDGFQELGVWNNSHGLTETKNRTLALLQMAKTLEHQTLRVVVYLEEPFVMIKESQEHLTGNDRYEGFCIDLLYEIAKIAKFNYTIHTVKDNSYGSFDENTRKWSGLVGDLVNGNADLSVSALTISYGRSQAIDFTVPFMHLGISILFKKPDRKDPSLFSFLSPLSLDVWIYMLAAYLGVSLMLWVLARFSPYEWFNPHPCNPNSDVMENQFSLLNSLWFTVGSLMQQGSDLAPRAASTRLVAGVWWFFTLILISSYTANLAAFLTVERMVPQIESAEDLAKQTKIKYGSLNRGSTMAFFAESKIPTYERMWGVMRSAQQTVFVNNSQDGINRVLHGDYAYLMESAMLEYYVERNCNLTQVNGLLDSKGYGIGLPKGSKYREILSSAVLQLQEKAILAEMKNRWWKEKRGGGKCKDDGTKSHHSELGLKNVGGVFVALLCGLAMALLIGIIEFLYKAAQNADENQGTTCQAMWRDLKFALRCKGSKKHTLRRKSAPVITGYFDDGTLVPAFGVNCATGYTALAARSLEALSPRSNR